MPSAPRQPCSLPGCKRLTKGGRCDLHRAEYERDRYYHIGHRLYSTRAWKNLRASVIDAEPVCRLCDRLATSVDHIVPHHGDRARFFDPDNLQPLCRWCHAAKSRQEMLT